MKNILVLGQSGLLGTAICTDKILSSKYEFYLAIPRMDITKSSFWESVNEEPLDAVINCTGYTDVKNAENEINKAMEVNYIGARNVVKFCEERDIPLLHMSTDYVYSGKIGLRKYREDDQPDPINVYGQSKYLGELEVQKYSKSFIVRTSSLYNLHEGDSFVKDFVHIVLGTPDYIRVIDRHHMTPTPVQWLAPLLLRLLETDKYGIYHIVPDGYCTWYEFATLIAKQLRLNIDVMPVKEIPNDIPRPAHSVLDNTKAKSVLNNPSSEITNFPRWDDLFRSLVYHHG